MSKVTQKQVNDAMESEFDGYPLDCIVQELLELRAQNKEFRVVLEKLARLGNGTEYGTSIGNLMAQQALKGGE